MTRWRKCSLTVLIWLQVTLKLIQYGGTMDPHAAFLLTRGLATLGLRVKQQNKNGLAVAEFLTSHPKVNNASNVYLCGLAEIGWKAFTG